MKTESLIDPEAERHQGIGLIGAPFVIEIADWPHAETRVMPLRIAVFVDEQGVPADIEHDEWDAQSMHAIAIAKDGAVIGTGRLLPDGHIGRMAVARTARNAGIGSALLKSLTALAARRGHASVVLNAQISAQHFYERHGFSAEGPRFLDAGIEHVTMRRNQPRRNQP
jgi:predicted GNAT family N-acyltransferase